MKQTIYLDMDGVLVDFELGVIQLLGRPFDDDWETLPENFFKNLPKQPDANLLIEKVMALSQKFNYEVSILTAIPRRRYFIHAEQHKKEWIETNYPFIKTFKIGPYAIDKQAHCKPGDILIDDSHLNIPQWGFSGGYGILHKSAASSISLLTLLLETLHEQQRAAFFFPS